MLVCHDPVRFMIYDFRFTIWQAAVVLPHARQVLETRLRKLARSLLTFARNAQQIVDRRLKSKMEWCGCRELRPDIRPGEATFCC